MVHVIVVEPRKIITQRMVSPHDAPGVARLSVQERHGKGVKPANGYVWGFGERFDGAIASSVGHDSHNLIVAGKRPSDMKLALSALIECGGGFCVVQGGRILAKLPLPLGGLMTTAAPESVTSSLVALHEASRAVGCELSEPFLQLAFLSLPVIPRLKLTNMGLVDVEAFSLIPVAA
jgi:adenine deaminase